eukprot:s8866_g1.t1
MECATGAAGNDLFESVVDGASETCQNLAGQYDSWHCTEIVSNTAAKAGLESQLETAHAKAQESEREHAATASAAKASTDEVLTQLEEAKARIQQLEASASSAQASHQKLESELAEAQRQVEQKQQELDEVSSTTQALRSDLEGRREAALAEAKATKAKLAEASEAEAFNAFLFKGWEFTNVKSLKKRLNQLHGMPPRFRQQLLLNEQSLVDEAKIEAAPMDLDLVVLTFA